jgi:hypothetical protein
VKTGEAYEARRTKQLSEALARHREKREQRRDRVIAEFDSDLRALADEVIYLRRVVDNVSEAVGLARAGAPFAVMGPGPHWRPGKQRSDNGRRTEPHARTEDCARRA